MDRDVLLAEIVEGIGDRALVWAGLRGDDIESLADLPQLAGSFTIANAYARRTDVYSLAYEDLAGAREDPEVWDIDFHLDEPPSTAFRHALLRALAGPSILLPYRPSSFLSSIWFARRETCDSFGLFGGHQAAFDHKPWVETAVRGLGIPRIPWVYVADEDQLQAQDLVGDGPVVLRRSRTSGGEGFLRAESLSELRGRWPHVAEAFVSVAPYLEGGTPINIGATVWQDGKVTVHYPSVQLIGIPECVTRPFGYCGNDFGMAKELEPAIIDEIEDSTVRIGSWLGQKGYLGSFGVDYLIHDGKALFTEVNPRFQGSTHASNQLSLENGEACLLLEHLAAWLGMSPQPQQRLSDRVRQIADLAHIVVHWTGEDDALIDPNRLVLDVLAGRRDGRADVLTNRGLVTRRGAVLARLTVRDRVTTTGFDLSPAYCEPIRHFNENQMTISRSGG